MKIVDLFRFIRFDIYISKVSGKWCSRPICTRECERCNKNIQKVNIETMKTVATKIVTRESVKAVSEVLSAMGSLSLALHYGIEFVLKVTKK